MSVLSRTVRAVFERGSWWEEGGFYSSHSGGISISSSKLGDTRMTANWPVVCSSVDLSSVNME